MKTIFIKEHGLVVRKSSQSLVVTKENNTIEQVPILSVDGIVIMGNSQITEQALRLAASKGIYVVHAQADGRIVACTNPYSEKRCKLRLQQYESFLNEGKRLAIAKEIVAKKMAAQERFLKQRRAIRFTEKNFFSMLHNDLKKCESINEVLGVEGRGAGFYFSNLSRFSLFTRRSRRPAKDSINALMNLAYSLWLNRICSVLLVKGFDIQLGFLHSPKDGRPSLALDILEFYRSELDAFVVKITNRKEFCDKDFASDPQTGKRYLKKESLKKFLDKFYQVFDGTEALIQECERFKKLISPTIA